MPNYYEPLLEIVNKQGYRLPEAHVFRALEDFRTQCNQVLAYQNLSIQYRHFIRDPDNPLDDGGSMTLNTASGALLAEIATWSYNHPFHTFPITFLFDKEKYVCQTDEDMEIALKAMLANPWFRDLLHAEYHLKR